MAAFPIALADFRTGSIRQPLHFSRASFALSQRNESLVQVDWNVPRTGADFRRPTGALIERRSANMLAHSEGVGRAPWTKISLDIVRAPSTWQGPMPGAVPFLLSDTVTPGLHVLYQNSQPIVPQVTFSGFYKSRELSKIQLLVNDEGPNNIYAGFDLLTGQTVVVGQEGSGADTTAAMEDVGQGWWRCIVSGVMPAAAAAYRVHSFLIDNDKVSYAGGCGSVYCWGLQMEPGLIATSFIATPPDKGQIRETEQLLLDVSGSSSNIRAVVVELEATSKAVPAPILYFDNVSERSDLSLWQHGEQLLVYGPAFSEEDVLQSIDLPSTWHSTRRIGVRLWKNVLEIWVGGACILEFLCGEPLEYSKCFIGGGKGLNRWDGIIAAVEAYIDTPSNSQMQAVTV